MITELEEELRSLIKEEVIFLQHYIGEVHDNVDPMQKGRISVLIYELGWDDPEIAIWCFPRFNNSCIIPEVGDWVEVYFIAGNRQRPVYLPFASEVAGMESKTHSGVPSQKVLFEGRQTGSNIVYDESTDILTIFKGSDFAVRYSKLELAFNTLKDDYNNFKALHKHGGITAGGASTLVPDIITPCTADITQAKVLKVKMP